MNARYFRGTLWPIQILWSARLTASAGLFVSRTGPRAAPFGTSDLSGRLIRLSGPLLHGRPDGEIIGTLAHEMIHQWQFDTLKRRPNHGADFRRMMAIMNLDGLGITIRHTLDEAVQALAKYVWRCQQCGRDYERQRRTIRPRRHRCGACRGPLREVPRHDAPGPAPGLAPSGRQHAETEAGFRVSGSSGRVIQLFLDFSPAADGCR